MKTPAHPVLPEVAGSYNLGTANCYITVASRTSAEEARQFIHQSLSDKSTVRVFRATNGYYAVTVRNQRDEVIALFRGRSVANGKPLLK